MKCTYIYRLRFYTIHIVHILTARICLFIYAYIKWLHYTTLAIYFPPIMIASQMYFMYIMLLRFTHNICMYNVSNVRQVHVNNFKYHNLLREY